MIDVTLPIDMTPANKLLRTHYRQRKELKTSIQWELLVAGIKHNANPPKERRRVHLTRILGPKQRRFDADNLPASFKLLIDCLRFAGVILDDSPAWIDLVVDEDITQRENGPAVRVRVEPA